MALFVFSWTKREYIMTLLSLIMLAITASHREFFLCRETSLNRVEKFGVWIGVMDKPEPCPGTEDLHSMTLEMGASTLAAVGATHVVPWLWNRTKSMIGQGVKRVKDGLQYVKDCCFNARSIPDVTDDDDESDDGYYSLAYDIVPPADRDPTEDKDHPTDRDPTEDRGPHEDRGTTDERDPTEDRDSTDNRDRPENRDTTPNTDPPSLAESTRGTFGGAKYGPSKSQYKIIQKAYDNRRVILLLKRGEQCNQVYAYNPITGKFVLRSYFPSRPRFGVPGWKNKVMESRN